MEARIEDWHRHFFPFEMRITVKVQDRSESTASAVRQALNKVVAESPKWRSGRGEQSSFCASGPIEEWKAEEGEILMYALSLSPVNAIRAPQHKALFALVDGIARALWTERVPEILAVFSSTWYIAEGKHCEKAG